MATVNMAADRSDIDRVLEVLESSSANPDGVSIRYVVNRSGISERRARDGLHYLIGAGKVEEDKPSRRKDSWRYKPTR